MSGDTRGAFTISVVDGAPACPIVSAATSTCRSMDQQIVTAYLMGQCRLR